MPENQEEWLPLRLVDSPAVLLPSDVCVFSTIPEVEAFRFAAWWMKRADEATDRLAASLKHAPRSPTFERLRIRREETYRIYLEDVWDQTFDRYHETWAAAREVAPALPAAVDRFFYRFSD